MKNKYENWNTLLNFLINCTSERSAPQILSIKGENAFRFSNFLIIGLCNSSARSLLDMISFLIAPPANLLVRVAEFFY